MAALRDCMNLKMAKAEDDCSLNTPPSIDVIWEISVVHFLLFVLHMKKLSESHLGVEAGIRKAQKKCNEYDQVSEKGGQIQGLKQSRETCWGQWRPTPRSHWGWLSLGLPRRWGSRPASTRWNPTLQSGLCLVWKTITLKTLSKTQWTQGAECSLPK